MVVLLSRVVLVFCNWEKSRRLRMDLYRAWDEDGEERAGKRMLCEMLFNFMKFPRLLFVHLSNVYCLKI